MSLLKLIESHIQSPLNCMGVIPELQWALDQVTRWILSPTTLVYGCNGSLIQSTSSNLIFPSADLIDIFLSNFLLAEKWSFIEKKTNIF